MHINITFKRLSITYTFSSAYQEFFFEGRFFNIYNTQLCNIKCTLNSSYWDCLWLYKYTFITSFCFVWYYDSLV